MDSPQKEKSLIWVLLETSSDGNEEVRQTVSSSIITLGCQHPALVLSTMHRFLDNPHTAPKAHFQSILYNTAEGIIRECGEKIDDKKVISVWINNCKELLIHPTVALELQQAASCFLVALGSLQGYCHDVSQTLIDLIKSDAVPLQSVVETLSSLACSNSRGIARYFKELITKILPCLPNIKQDYIKVAVCFMFGKFAEAVVDAVANIIDLQLTIEGHYSECALLFDALVNNWLKNSVVTVKNEVIVSLGHMSCLLSREHLELYNSSVIISILGHYKKNPCPFALTSSLALICDSIIKAGIVENLKVHIDSMLVALFSQVCVTPNYSEPLTVKNHCEVLRCYEILSKNFPEIVLTQLLQRLDNASYVQRVGALLVVKHLVNSHSLSEEQISKLINALSSLITDPNSKVVKSLTQVIVALCHNNCLNNSTGHSFVTYLVQHSAGGSLSPVRRSSLNHAGEETVGDTCCRALNLLSTTVSHSPQLLWPHLLQFITANEYEDSLPTVLACCAHLATRTEPTPENIDTTKNIFLLLPSTASSPILVTRLLILSYLPSKYEIGLSAINLLEGLAGHISYSLNELWTEKCPTLRKTYVELSPNISKVDTLQEWQKTLYEFMGYTLRYLLSDSFTSNLIAAQMEQLEHYSKNQAYRAFIMSLIGVSLQHCNDENLIHSTLDTLYQWTNHKSSTEQKTFSITVGMCSSSHLALALYKLESWLKACDSSKRSISILSLIRQQDTKTEEILWIRTSIVNCLGQICTLASPELVGSQIDGPIMLHLLNIINSNKSDLVNDAILLTTSKIAKSLLQLQAFKLRQRPLLIQHIVNTMKEDSISLFSLTNCLLALSDLSALEPELNVEERTIVLQSALSSTLLKLQDATLMDETLDNCYAQLYILIRILIQHDTNPATLDDVTTLLHSWTLSPSDIVRGKSIDLLYLSFVTYIQHVVLTHTGPTTFGQTYQLLSILTPRFADPCLEIRKQAVSCLHLVLKIAGRYLGQTPDYTDEDFDSLNAVEEIHIKSDKDDLGDHLILIAKVLCNKLTFSHLRLYLNVAVSGLMDKKEKAASGVARIFSAIFTLRGHQFHHHIKEILDSVYNRLEKVTDLETRHFTVEAICNLARHNLNTVLDIILDYPIPYERGICETLQRLAFESELCSLSLHHLMQILERTQPFSEQKTAFQDTVRIATIPSLAVVCSMKELLSKLSKRKNTVELSDASDDAKLNIFKNNEMDVSKSQKIVEERFPSIAAALLLTYGSYIGVMAPLHQSSIGTSRNAFIPNRGATTLIPSKSALECLQSLVAVVGCVLLDDSIKMELQTSNSESLEDLLHSLVNITVLLVQEIPQQISSLVAYLDTHHSHEMQRVTVTAVLGQLVAERCCGDFELLEIIMTGLLSRLNDKSVQVRRLAVRGLANFSCMKKDQLQDKMNEILSALVVATDLREGTDSSSEGQVAQEALKGLATILPNLPSDIVLQHAPTLLIRIRLFIEKNGEVREAAAGVLRGLSVTVGNSDEFKEHIHLHLLAALIHLCDPYPPVVVMCKSALQALGHHISSENINKIFQDYLVPSSDLCFQSFVALLSRHMTADLSDHIPLFIQAASSYFKHTEASIRKAAVLLIGNLVYQCSEHLDNSILQKISNGMIVLMKDSDASVRAASALSVPFFFKHEHLL